MQFHDERAAAIADDYEYIRSPKHQHLKDIWCAARFGLGHERYLKKNCLLHVNNVQNSDTDFFLKLDKTAFPFQTIIADVPDRKMADDHRPERGLLPYEPERHRSEGPSWIESAVDKKIAKQYIDVANLNLLVYANLSAHYQTYDMLCSKIRSDQKIFNSMWIITNHQICSVYSTPTLGSIMSLSDITDWGH